MSSTTVACAQAWFKNTEYNGFQKTYKWCAEREEKRTWRSITKASIVWAQKIMQQRVWAQTADSPKNFPIIKSIRDLSYIWAQRRKEEKWLW